jgi:hypothetical protein
MKVQLLCADCGTAKGHASGGFAREGPTPTPTQADSSRAWRRFSAAIFFRLPSDYRRAWAARPSRRIDQVPCARSSRALRSECPSSGLLAKKIPPDDRRSDLGSSFSISRSRLASTVLAPPRIIDLIALGQIGHTRLLLHPIPLPNGADSHHLVALVRIRRAWLSGAGGRPTEAANSTARKAPPQRLHLPAGPERRVVQGST